MPTRVTIPRVPVARKGFPLPPAVRAPRVVGRAALKKAVRHLSKRPRPLSYSRQTVTRLLQESGIGSRASAVGLWLSAQVPYVANKALLYFFQPAEYRTEQDDVILYDAFMNGGAALGIQVRGDPGALYVLDMRVSGGPSLTFETIPTGGSVLRPDAKGHVLMVVQGTATGRADVALNGARSGLWIFHDVVVRKVL
jgi:hypothetical protein